MENDLRYKRIIIFGGCGSGKSTLGDRISKYTNYSVYHLDNLLLDSKWKIRDKDKWEEISQIFLTKDTGVVDGNYINSASNRIQWADLIIFIDVSVLLQLYRYFKRVITVGVGLEKRYGKPDKSRTIIRFSIIKWILSWNKKDKTKIFSMLELAKDRKVLIIKEPRKLDLEKLFK